MIASIIDASSLRDHEVHALGPDFFDGLYEIFPDERAERAETLIEIIVQWSGTLPSEAPRTTVAEVRSRVAPSSVPVTEQSSGLPVTEDPAEIGAPAFLRSDRVDEDDTARLFGSARSYVRIILAVLSVLALVGAGVAVWWWANSRDADVVVAPEESADTETAADLTVAEAATPTPVPTPSPVPALPTEREAWADTATILNAGTGSIAASTYPVSTTNRAVLTGHTDAITGIAVSNDGRVLTSGADRRLVDWGADVTLASPDVLDVAQPLTALTRTVDQRIIAGDVAGNITVIDLITPTDPLVLPIHESAIAAVAEIQDGRFAVASVDGDVAVLAAEAPGDTLLLSHATEVTAIVALDDGSIATSAVDGLIRIWLPTGGTPVATIDTLATPATALAALSDGRLAVGLVDGRILVVAAADSAEPDLVIDAHDGAVRALFEFEDQAGELALATGSEDTTIRLFSLDTGIQWQQLDGHGDRVTALNQLPDGRLISTSSDATGRVWDLTLEPGTVVAPPHSANLSHLVAFRNGQIVTGGVDGVVTLSSTSPPSAPIELTRHDAPVVGLTVMPNGDIVSVDAASRLRLFQAGAEDVPPFELAVAPGATALDDRGELGIVTGHADGTVRFSDFTAEVGSIPAHVGGVNAVLGLQSGLVASAGEDNTVRVLDFDDPDLVRVFDLHAGPVDALAELPDGRIASAGSDGIFVWSVDDMGLDHIRLTGHQSTILTVEALPDGRLISTGTDGRVRVWDLQNPDADSATAVDIPGIVNPVLTVADNGLLVAGAGRGFVVFTIE